MAIISSNYKVGDEAERKSHSPDTTGGRKWRRKVARKLHKVNGVLKEARGEEVP